MTDTTHDADQPAEAIDIEPYEGPAGGWGSAKSVGQVLTRQHLMPRGALLLLKQNKANGFMCSSCAWAKPASPHPFEFCESGAKATTWEATTRRAGPEFFADHKIAELESWPDHDLENLGRLTHPMRWNAKSDRYEPVSWADAFKEIGAELRQIDPHAAVLYASGRASLETSYMYQLFARMYGTNNLPDSSNMCHESTSVALPESIGVPVGTVRLEDFEHTDCIFFFGQNVGTSSPRMLHQLRDARKRGIEIVTFNPLRERGLERFTNPQSPTEMLTGHSTTISTQYHQVRAGGDTAAIYGICKVLIEADEAAQASGQPRVLDAEFIAEHTHGFEEFAASVRSHSWDILVHRSGLSRRAIEDAARVYMNAKAVMGVYGMGLTQHRTGVENCQMVANLLLLRGNIGKPGAGICPVRGHSNVQGQRTVGISEKPELVPLDRLAKQFNFEPPRWKGLSTVEACKGILRGEVKAFIGLGGNFIRAIPETAAMESAWRKLRLTVQISTKLNRNHVVHGEVSYILPCLTRTEIDQQSSGAQIVTIEDSTACIHASRGAQKPASEHLLSEARVVAELAKATGVSGSVDWDGWVNDYSLVRDAIEQTWPDQFKDFNGRMNQPGGFTRPNAARERKWNTKTGKANFIAARSLCEDLEGRVHDPDALLLITLRSNDQFNTTIYGYDDRFRGVHGTRQILFMNASDISRLGLADGERVTVSTIVDDGVSRRVSGLQIVAYDIPQGCCAGYYPECNPLLPLWHHAERSMVPAAKSIPVKISRSSTDVATSRGSHEYTD